MKKSRIALCILSVTVAAVCAAAAGCGMFRNPGDYLGGGGTATYWPSETDTALDEEAVAAAGSIDAAAYTDASSVRANATEASTSIKKAGSYYIEGDSLDGEKISVKSDGVTLYLIDAVLSNSKKVIEADGYSLTITLIGSSTVSNTNADGSNAIDVSGELTINGPGKLTVSATKNGIKGGSIKIRDAEVDVTADKDGLHAEIDEYDDLTSAPQFSYGDGGFVYTQDAIVKVVSEDDGIQADTFVYITGDTVMDITTNGGAPSSLSQITDTSSDNVSGKGIKAGNIDWGSDDSELDGDYLIYITGGDITIDSNDDAVHSNSTIIMTGGTLNVATGDDGMHADDLMKISGGNITIDRCYEGIEAAKVEISGGDISVTSSDDGINGADGTANAVNVANNNCHIIISGGEIYVDAKGDGIDSNGSMLISGGAVYVSGSTSGADAALDADGTIIVDGGYVFACGALGMVEVPASNSGQYVVSYASESSIEAGKTLYLTDKDKNTIMYFELPKKCQSVILSAPELEEGATYYIYGDSTSLCSFTVSSIITSIGSSKSISSGGGTPGGTMPGGSGHGSRK